MKVVALSFREFSIINAQRAAKWHHGFPKQDRTDPTYWSGADWSNAACGEAGEMANVVKKLRRHETSARGAVDPPPVDLLEKLGDELADVITYVDLVATFYGIDLAAAVVRKFNAISEREGLPQRIEVVP